MPAKTADRDYPLVEVKCPAAVTVGMWESHAVLGAEFPKHS